MKIRNDGTFDPDNMTVLEFAVSAVILLALCAFQAALMWAVLS